MDRMSQDFANTRFFGQDLRSNVLSVRGKGGWNHFDAERDEAKTRRILPFLLRHFGQYFRSLKFMLV